jgi:hypothetical protein
MAREGKAGRHNAVFVVVILGHALLIVFFLRPDVLTKDQLKKSASSLLLLDLSIPIPPSKPVPLPEAVTKAHEAKRTKVDSATSLDSAAISSLDTPPSPPGIDWYQQGQQVATSRAELIFKELKGVCEKAALRGEHRPECRKYKKPDAWVPEPKKFGISGGLPYVRLGKRCVLGLGFFGCGVGKLPEADGHVLDDMRDPNRPRSSVPDPSE